MLAAFARVALASFNCENPPALLQDADKSVRYHPVNPVHPVHPDSFLNLNLTNGLKRGKIKR